MRLGLLTLAILLVACDQRPELALCETVQTCDYAQLVVNEDVCADQVQAVLRDQGPDCQRCVTGLKCTAIEGVLAGKDRIPSLCSSCGDSIDVQTVEAGGKLFLTPAIIKKAKPPEAAPQNDELVAQADAVCTQGEECEGAQLLLNKDECLRQVSSVLVTRDPECRRCSASLSCAGVLAVIHGEQRLSSLCGTCGAMVDPRSAGPVGPGGPYLLIPGFVAVPPPPPEGAAEVPVAKPETAPAPAAPAAAAPAPKAPVERPVAPAQPIASAANPAPNQLVAPAAVPPLPPEITQQR